MRRYTWADSEISESAGSLQAFSDGLLEHGLVADAGLFGDLLRPISGCAIKDFTLYGSS